MQYINPVEILGLTSVTDSISIDNEIIKKAKRKLFADIDLSDNGHIEYYGLRLTKGDCERAIEELTNNDLKEFYLHLALNKELNEFLINGNDEVFRNFKQDSIFLLPEFVKFISPFFAPKFDEALLKAFKDEDVKQTKSILKTSFLISQGEINIAYKSISNNIKNKISEIVEIKNDINNEESTYDESNIEDVVYLVVEYFPTDILNYLPNYFQSQIVKIAEEVNYLFLSIWKNIDNSQVCVDLLSHILTLNIGGLNRPIFKKNYEIARKKNQERIEQEKNAPILRKYADLLLQIETKIQDIKNKNLTPSSLLSWVNNTISITDINALSNVFDEIKNQVALSLQAISVEVWNSFSNIDVSIDLINKANNITGLKAEIQQNLRDAKKQLTELKTKSDIANLATQRATLPGDMHAAATESEGPPEALTQEDIHKLAESAGVDIESKAFMDACETLTGQRHLDDMTPAQLSKMSHYILDTSPRTQQERGRRAPKEYQGRNYKQEQLELTRQRSEYRRIRQFFRDLETKDSDVVIPKLQQALEDGRVDRQYGKDNLGCLISIICFVFGGILLANDVRFGSFLILIGLFLFVRWMTIKL